MKGFVKKINFLINNSFFPYLVLVLVVFGIYYKFTIFGKIPFPGDLLIGSYSPWFDYYKMPVQNPLISDVFSQLILWKHLSIDSFKLGQWPLWNPYSFMGTPFLATYQSATLYPLNLLLFLPKYFGWGIFIFSQTLFALVNMFLLMGLFVKSRLARLIGAVIFGFGGLMTTWVEQGISVHGIIWLPLSLYLIEKFAVEFKLRYLMFLIGSFALTILAGHAQMTIYSFIILFAYTFIRTFNRNLKVFFSRFLFIAVSLVLAVLFCAPQLLSSLSLFQESIRITETYTQEFNFGLLPFKDILKFFIADFFGNPVTRNYWGFLNYFETSGFIGTLTLPLIIYAYLFLKKTKRNIFFLVLLPLTLIFAFDNPVSNFIYQTNIPLLTSSYASRILFISTLSFSILSAFSLNQMLQDHEKQNIFLKLVFWSWAAILGIIIGTFISQFMIWDILNLEAREQYLKYYLNDREYALTNFSVALKNSIPPLFLISSFLLLFLALGKFKSKFGIKNSTTLICIGLFVLTTLDLGRYFLKFNPFVSPSLIFPNVPALDFLQKQSGLFRVGREHAEILPPNTWIAYNLQSYEGYDPVYLNQYGKFMHFLNGGDIRTGNSSRYAEIASNYSSPFLDAANTRFFVAILRDKNGYIPGDLLNFRVKDTPYNLIFKDKSAAILENPNALSRAYFAPSIITLPESKIMDLVMTDKSFDPRKIITLSKDLGINSVTGKGSTKVVYYSPNLVKINTENFADEVLVLADQFEDGWKAKVDNKETVISPANLIFRAIKVPAGKHEITFWYWPKSFDIGLKISLLASLFAFLLGLFSIKMKRF